MEENKWSQDTVKKKKVTWWLLPLFTYISTKLALVPSTHTFLHRFNLYKKSELFWETSYSKSFQQEREIWSGVFHSNTAITIFYCTNGQSDPLRATVVAIWYQEMVHALHKRRGWRKGNIKQCACFFLFPLSFTSLCVTSSWALVADVLSIPQNRSKEKRKKN